jgi:hypothetical protein
MTTDEPGHNEPEGNNSSADDYLDEQEADSFPSSDPHSDWAGPG